MDNVLKERQEWQRLQEAEQWCHQRKIELLQNLTDSILKNKAETTWDNFYANSWHNDDNAEIDMITAILDSFATGPTKVDKVIKNRVHSSARPKRCPHLPNETCKTQHLINNMHQTLNFNNTEGVRVSTIEKQRTNIASDQPTLENSTRSKIIEKRPNQNKISSILLQ
jgi:hypothetical protein